MLSPQEGEGLLISRIAVAKNKQKTTPHTLTQNNTHKTTNAHRKSYASLPLQLSATRESSTVYVGNLSPRTPSSVIYNYFSMAGEVTDIILGVNRVTKERCSFCFVIYSSPSSARAAVHCLSHANLGDTAIRVELDPGFKPGREFGRGKSGGQVRWEKKGGGGGRGGGGDYRGGSKRSRGDYSGGDRGGYNGGNKRYRHNDNRGGGGGGGGYGYGGGPRGGRGGHGDRYGSGYNNNGNGSDRYRGDSGGHAQGDRFRGDAGGKDDRF